MRKIFTIVAVVIVLAGVGVATYIYFASDPGVAVAPPGTTSLPAAGENPQGQVTGAAPTAPQPAAPVPVTARLVKISEGPVVPGVSVVDIKATASTSADVQVRYIERQNGNIYLYSVPGSTLTRISNRTVPGIEAASWLPDGSFAFVRYLSGDDFSTINTYALPSSSSNNGFFLAQNLSDLAVSAKGLLTLVSGVNGSIASLSKTDGSGAVQAFSSPLSSLRAAFAGAGQYLAFTKPSAALPGAAFLSSGGNFSRVAGPLRGLVAKASPSGAWILVSYTTEGGMLMQLVNAATREVIPLPVATIADKCVWTTDDGAIYCGVPVDPRTTSYPDDWYQGMVSFNDRVWRIQVSGRYAQLVLDFSKEMSETVDIASPALNPSGTVLVFTNKNDGSLWSYSL